MDMGILKSLIYQTKCNMCDLVIEIIEKENINLELSEKEIISISVIEWWKKWDPWASIIQAEFDWDDIVFTKDDTNQVVLENAKQELKWEKWDDWDKWDPFTYDDFTPEQLEGLKWPKGDKWDDGDIGDTGKSAYQIRLDLGNIGTEQDFIDSLKWEDWKELTAGENVNITDEWVISAIDTKYTASDFDLKDLNDVDWLKESWLKKVNWSSLVMGSKQPAEMIEDTENHTIYKYTYENNIILYRQILKPYAFTEDKFFKDMSLSELVCSRPLLFNI